jgi:hypothetical protein
MDLSEQIKTNRDLGASICQRLLLDYAGSDTQVPLP